MANGLAFAANYSHDPHLMDVTRTAFANGFLAFKGSSGGKGIGSPIASAPMAIYEVSKFPGPTLDGYIEQMAEQALDPGRRRLPANIPNPDFEMDAEGWGTRGGLALERTTEVAHSGQASAMASGHIERANEYLVTDYVRSALGDHVAQAGCGLPIAALAASGPARAGRARAHRPHRATEQGRSSQGAFVTGRYDMSRPGTCSACRPTSPSPRTVTPRMSP